MSTGQIAALTSSKVPGTAGLGRAACSTLSQALTEMPPARATQRGRPLSKEGVTTPSEVGHIDAL